MSMVMITIYIILCILLAFVGRRTRVGAIGVFLLALLFTPLAVGLVLAVLRPTRIDQPAASAGGD